MKGQGNATEADGKARLSVIQGLRPAAVLFCNVLPNIATACLTQTFGCFWAAYGHFDSDSTSLICLVTITKPEVSNISSLQLVLVYKRM